MQVLAIIGQKGGSGKTTTALGLAVEANSAGKAVAIIDLDPQTTAANWSDRRGEESPAVVSCQVSRLAQVLDAAAKNGAALAIIDTPGKSTDALIAAAKAADFVLVPITAYSNTPALVETEITLDGTSSAYASLQVYSYNAPPGPTDNILAIAPAAQTVSEGYHYTEILGAGAAGNYVTYPNGATTVMTVQ